MVKRAIESSAPAPEFQNCAARSPIAAEPMNAASRRRRRRTDEDAAIGRAIGVRPDDRTEEQLAQFGRAPVDVSTDVVWVVDFHLGGSADMPRQEHVSKPRS